MSSKGRGFKVKRTLILKGLPVPFRVPGVLFLGYKYSITRVSCAKNMYIVVSAT